RCIERCTAGSGRGPLEKDPPRGNLASGLPVLLHGTPVGNLIYFSLDLDSSRLRIEVHDARGDRLPTLAAPGLDGETGRGLQLVDSLTASWGCSPRRPIGKIVWGEVAG
ncbi:ATP-binding protein, partial [Kitasatospora sp. NPDC094011]|uniref:ATP-binding protein n=1 Tax=Kitasatospora sp. NPDC094011 TaxID=3364090 RepID=UPI0038154A27